MGVNSRDRSEQDELARPVLMTELPHFRWIRFWSPNGSSINLNFDGYLPDPEERYGALINPNLVRFPDIDTKRLLVFLGEPGIGKTDALNSARKAVEEEAARSEDLIEWIELQAYSSTEQLDRDVFEGDTFQKWLASDRELHLFLDSFDECRLLIPNLAAFLIARFKRKRYPAERLRLRIACRAAEWPGTLSNELSALWPKDQTGIYELAPLRRRDVRLAAEQIALNPEDFLAAISKADVVPLAIRPITLEFLLKQFAQDQRFPSRKADLYLRGCELLAQESSATRRMAGLEGNLTPGQRLLVASRIAATSFFCNRPTILIGPDSATREARDLLVEDLVGEREGTESHSFDVGKAQIEESLRTGLFTSRGSERLGFAHQTYGEFLAAHHLVARQTPLDQVLPLLTQIDGDRRVIVPQLLETAAWLATMRTDLFDALAEDNPGALLASDVGVHESERRAKLVASLFAAIDGGFEHDVWRDFRRHYHKLMHPGLADQLRPLVGERSKNFMARRVAIKMAKQCRVQELGPDLLRLAIDDSECEELRSRAISALADCGDAASLDSIKSWLLSRSSPAASDDLRGEAFQLLWPRRMTADELFSALVAPKREEHIGTYQIFLSTRIVSALEATDLPIALAWAAHHPPMTNSPFSVERLIDQILLKAWSQLDDRLISDGFALAALARLKARYSLISLAGFDDESKRLKELLNNDHDRRRLVVLALLSRLADDDDNAVTLVFGRGSLVRTSDVPWLLEQLRSAAPASQPMLARLIKFAFDPLEPVQSSWSTKRRSGSMRSEKRSKDFGCKSPWIHPRLRRSDSSICVIWKFNWRKTTE